MEHRYTIPHEVRLAKTADGPAVLSGYAAVFYDGTPATEYRVWSDLIERIAPGAFDRAISEKQDVRALTNHDANRVLGRTGPDTLRLSVDGIGLRYVIDIPDTEPGRTIAANVERGDVTGSSFSFIARNREFIENPDGSGIVVIRDVDLFDVGPVTFPAYEGTTAGARAADGSLDELRGAYDAWKAERLDAAIWELKARRRSLELELSKF